MPIAQSRVTAQGQISVPAEIRKRLGLGRGAVLEWEARGDEVVVRRAGKFTSSDVHHALFADDVPAVARADVKEGIRKYIRKRHARR